MRKILFLLIAMLMSCSISTFASTKTNGNMVTDSPKFEIPTNIIIKQTITFKDGNTVTVYYQKTGDLCKVFSKNDITKYTEDDINRIKSSNFEITDRVEGKCIITKKTSDVMNLAKNIFKKNK